MSLSSRYIEPLHITTLGIVLSKADRISQRNLNNAFAYDLVPSPSVITAALKAARRVNDYPTAVRIFEGTPHQSPARRYAHRHEGTIPEYGTLAPQ